MAGSLTAQLVATNAILTEQLVRLATAVIESGIKPVVVGELGTVPAVPELPVIPSFEEFSKNLDPEERLFYTEEQEDQMYTQALSGDTAGDPQLTKEILEAAGHHDLAAQVTAT